MRMRVYIRWASVYCFFSHTFSSLSPFYWRILLSLGHLDVHSSALSVLPFPVCCFLLYFAGVCVLCYCLPWCVPLVSQSPVTLRFEAPVFPSLNTRYASTTINALSSILLCVQAQPSVPTVAGTGYHMWNLYSEYCTLYTLLYTTHCSVVIISREEEVGCQGHPVSTCHPSSSPDLGR